MSFSPKFPLTFESSDGMTVATFPLANYSFESSQPLRVPSVPLIDADYEYDQLGTRPARKAPAVIRIAGIFFDESPQTVDDDLDTFEANLLNIGLGKLWMEDQSSARFWAWARPTAAPAIRWQAGDVTSKGITLEFRRQSDWQAEEATEVSEDYAESPHAWTVANGGLRRILNAVIVLSGTWTGPVTITNTTNGYAFTYDGGDAGSDPNDQVRFDSGFNRVDRSTDGGATWTNAFANYTPAVGQVQMMILEPGNNAMTVTDGGSPDANITVTFYA